MKPRQEGITLIECLVYVVVLMTLGNIIASTYIDTSRLAAYCGTAIVRQRTLNEFCETFIRTVHESTGTIDSVGPYRTDDTQLVLALSPADDDVKRFAVLGPVPDKAGLQRLNFREENGVPVLESCRLFRLPLAGVNIAYTKEENNACAHVTLDALVLNAAGDKRRPPVPYRFEGVTRMTGVPSVTGEKP
jgi:hypothetical protein